MTESLPDHSARREPWWVRVCPTCERQLRDASSQCCNGQFGTTVYVGVTVEEELRLRAENEALKRTPLHELVDLCREQGLALDFALYGPDNPPQGDDTISDYLGGARLTGHKGDPMDVIRAALRAQRDRSVETDEQEATG